MLSDEDIIIDMVIDNLDDDLLGTAAPSAPPNAL